MDVRPKDSPNRRGRVKMKKVENLLEMPVELLLQILSRLDVRSLGRLARVSRRLRQLCRDDVLWTLLLQTRFRVPCPSAVSSSSSSSFQPRGKFDVARVSHNWETGTFEARRVVSYRRNEIPRLRIAESQQQQQNQQQPQQRLYSSHGRVVEMRRRVKDARVETVFRGFETDVTDFVVGATRLIGASRDGSLGTWPLEDEKGRFTREERHRSGGKWKGKKKTLTVATRFMNCEVKGAHDGDIHALVAHGDEICVTGSRDSFVKLWKFREVDEAGVGEGDRRASADLLRAVPAEDRVWSLALSPDGAVFISGTAGLNGVPPLRLWDSESGRLLGDLGDATNAKNGAGVLHSHFETPYLLVSAGYDTFLRVWDLRTRKCALELEDPHDNAIYCACSDGVSPVIATGAARHAVVNVWDRRNVKLPMRMIYANVCEQKVSSSSPVYSLAMHWDRLYAAYDIGISVLDFGVCRTTRQNVQGSHSFSVPYYKLDSGR